MHPIWKVDIYYEIMSLMTINNFRMKISVQLRLRKLLNSTSITLCEN